MRRYLGRQTVQLVAVIVGISILSFSILHVIGDPVVLMVPETAPREEHERIRKLLGLDQPVWVQYWRFASRAVQGDFGKSWYADMPAFGLGAALGAVPRSRARRTSARGRIAGQVTDAP